MAIFFARPIPQINRPPFPDNFSDRGTSCELIIALFRTLPPTLIMTALFAGTGMLAYSLTKDGGLGLLAMGGVIASAGRIGIMVFRSGPPGAMDPQALGRFEKRFAVSYLCFAALVGLFVARLFNVGGPEFRIVAATLTVGYAAGVSAGIYVRPWICVPAILFGTVPIMLVTAVAPNSTIRLLAIIFVALTIGGIESAFGRYKAERDRIDHHRRLASLTRLDELTSLPNQLALADELEAFSDRHPRFHLIEIEGLSLLNRELGYALGDELIATIASRLAAAVGFDDFIARLTGGQFAVLEFDDYGFSSDLVVAKLGEALRAPLMIGGRTVIINATLKTVDVDRKRSASELLATVRAARPMML